MYLLKKFNLKNGNLDLRKPSVERDSKFHYQPFGIKFYTISMVSENKIFFFFFFSFLQGAV